MNVRAMPNQKEEGVENIHQTLSDTADMLLEQRDKALAFVALMDDMLENLARLRTGELPVVRPKTGPLRYAGLSVIDAIVEFLNKTGTPQTRQQLKEELRDGAALVHKGGEQVDRSIAYHAKPEDEKQQQYGARIKATAPKLKEIEGRVGLSEWGEERWKK